MPSILDSILRAGEGKILRQLKRISEQINSVEDDFAAMSDAELRAMTDEFKRRLTDDGEIQLRSRGVFLGYYRDPQATANILSADGWLSSGDIVEVLDNGEIMVVDRKKAIIITSGGKNIAPSEIENALKDSNYIAEAIVVGEARKFLGALIQINLDTVGRWARERGLAYTTFKSLTQLPEVRALVDEIVAGVNARFARVENIRRFVLLEKELDHDDGELTATQKVRRSVINAKFAKELVEIYVRHILR